MRGQKTQIVSSRAAAKKGTAGKTSLTSSASTPMSKNKDSSTVSACSGCGGVIASNTKALQCDRCGSVDAWKCIECLKISPEAYDVLLSGCCQDLHWFCETCEASVMSTPLKQKNDEAKANADTKLDRIEKLLENLVDKSTKIDQRLNVIECKLDEKADIKMLKEIEDRVYQA